jgi:protein-S-isoprenylcysteine O-methyltransferase Ste14
LNPEILPPMSLKSKLALYLFLVPSIVAALFFISAGSLRFWQAWTFMVLLSIPFISSFLYFYKHDRPLVERRLQGKEKIGRQKLLVKLLIPFAVAAYALPGLDYRFGWSRAYLGAVPLWLVVLSQVLALGGLLLVIWVMKVNSFASRTIQVEAGQKVISTGPYRMVRHPMYLGGLVMLLSMPLALGSYFAWPAFALLIPFFVVRLLNEEKVLRHELSGYPEYCLRTRFRLVPYVW